MIPSHNPNRIQIAAVAVPGRLPWSTRKADARSGRPRSNGPGAILKADCARPPDMRLALILPAHYVGAYRQKKAHYVK